MKALNNRQFNVLWRCFNNSSVVLGLPRGNIWYAPPRTVEILVRLGFLNVAGNRTRTITPAGIAAMQADDARWFAALESLDARRKASAVNLTQQEISNENADRRNQGRMS